MKKSKFTITNYFSGNFRECLRHPKHIISYFNMYISIIKTNINKTFKGSYSQYGEDLVIAKLLKNVENGTYVDVGANDPESLSNTKYFYEKGWNGINIEPNPVIFKKLAANRPKDINLNVGISNIEGEMTFYIMSADSLSTFSKESALASEKMGYKILETVNLPVIQLEKVFENHLKDKKVDFMSIDAEGHDSEVLKSNDWTKYRPTILLIEINQAEEDIKKYIENNNYELVFTNGTNGIFYDKSKAFK